MAKKNPERIPEKVKTAEVKREEGYLYYVDKEGDIARTPAKWNKDPRFLEKIQLEETKINEKMTSIPSNVVFSDAICSVEFSKSITAHHARVLSNRNTSIEGISDEELIHIMNIASMSSSALFEHTSAQGSNIILNEDGQINVSTIPRFQSDNLPLMWDIKQGDQEQIKLLGSKIRDALVIGEVKDFTKVNLDETPTNEKKKVNIVDPLPNKKKYMIDHLRRRP
jgi:hypothetical protein